MRLNPTLLIIICIASYTSIIDYVAAQKPLQQQQYYSNKSPNSIPSSVYSNNLLDTKVSYYKLKIAQYSYVSSLQQQIEQLQTQLRDGENILDQIYQNQSTNSSYQERLEQAIRKEKWHSQDFIEWLRSGGQEVIKVQEQNSQIKQQIEQIEDQIDSVDMNQLQASIDNDLQDILQQDYGFRIKSQEEQRVKLLIFGNHRQESNHINAQEFIEFQEQDLILHLRIFNRSRSNEEMIVEIEAKSTQLQNFYDYSVLKNFQVQFKTNSAKALHSESGIKHTLNLQGLLIINKTNQDIYQVQTIIYDSKNSAFFSQSGLNLEGSDFKEDLQKIAYEFLWLSGFVLLLAWYVSKDSDFLSEKRFTKSSLVLVAMNLVFFIVLVAQFLVSIANDLYSMLFKYSLIALLALLFAILILDLKLLYKIVNYEDDMNPNGFFLILAYFMMMFILLILFLLIFLENFFINYELVYLGITAFIWVPQIKASDKECNLKFFLYAYSLQLMVSFFPVYANYYQLNMYIFKHPVPIEVIYAYGGIVGIQFLLMMTKRLKIQRTPEIVEISFSNKNLFKDPDLDAPLLKGYKEQMNICKRTDLRKEECPICLEEMKTNQMKHLNCGHKLHKACFQDLLTKNLNKCPLCRIEF